MDFTFRAYALSTFTAKNANLGRWRNSARKNTRSQKKAVRLSKFVRTDSGQGKDVAPLFNKGAVKVGEKKGGSKEPAHWSNNLSEFYARTFVGFMVFCSFRVT